jgi:hypothetical protein
MVFAGLFSMILIYGVRLMVVGTPCSTVCIMGVNAGLAGWSTVTVAEDSKVERCSAMGRSMPVPAIGEGEMNSLVISGAANQNSVSVWENEMTGKQKFKTSRLNQKPWYKQWAGMKCFPVIS